MGQFSVENTDQPGSGLNGTQHCDIRFTSVRCRRDAGGDGEATCTCRMGGAIGVGTFIWLTSNPRCGGKTNAVRRAGAKKERSEGGPQRPTGIRPCRLRRISRAIILSRLTPRLSRLTRPWWRHHGRQNFVPLSTWRVDARGVDLPFQRFRLLPGHLYGSVPASRENRAPFS
jgi:hypothetical protein